MFLSAIHSILKFYIDGAGWAETRGDHGDLLQGTGILDLPSKKTPFHAIILTFMNNLWGNKLQKHRI